MDRSAAARVFDNSELVENILVYLDLGDILRCDNINAYFSNVIGGSRHLQEILNLKCQLELVPNVHWIDAEHEFELLHRSHMLIKLI